MYPPTPTTTLTHCATLVVPSRVLSFPRTRPQRPPIVPVNEGVLCANGTSPLELILYAAPAEHQLGCVGFEKKGMIDLEVGLEDQGWKDTADEAYRASVTCLEQCETRSRAEGEWVVVGLSTGNCLQAEVRTGRVLLFGRGEVSAPVVVTSKGVRGVFASGHDDGAVVVWGLHRKQVGLQVAKMSSRVSVIAINDDASRLLVTDETGGARIIDLKSKRAVDLERDAYEYGSILCAVWDRVRASIVYGGEDDRVIIRSHNDQKRHGMYAFHQSYVSGIVVYEGTIISCGWDGNLVIWSDNGQAYSLFAKENAVFYSLWTDGLLDGNLILYAAAAVDAQGKCIVYRFEITRWKQR